jgi:chromosome partitioning protein
MRLPAGHAHSRPANCAKSISPLDESHGSACRRGRGTLDLLGVWGAALGTVITIMNMKGGVGKTTVAIHLAGVMARYIISASQKPLKVLAIDYDPQFNLSQAFLPAKQYFALEKARKTTIAILFDDDTKLDPYTLQVPGGHQPPSVASLVTNITKTKNGVLDIIPLTLDLMYVALAKTDTQMKPIEERFEKFIAECKSVYDLIFIDCHPAGSIFTKTSLSNSDHVIIPVMPQRYAVRGIGLMMQFISAKKGAKAPTAHILFNNTPRVGTPAVETQIRSSKDYSSLCMTNTLKRY